MSVFCCCRSRRSLDHPPPTEQIELPNLPPPAKIPENHLITSDGAASRSLPPSLKKGSHISMPLDQDPLQLQQLVVEDSDTEDDDIGAASNKGSITLDAVKTKIIRHLSQDVEGKRQSNSSVGTSDEEVARRAELKRLMHKRIKEELRSEESNDHSSEISANSTGYLAPLIDLPGGGPRDTLEFSVADGTDINGPGEVSDHAIALDHEQEGTESRQPNPTLPAMERQQSSFPKASPNPCTHLIPESQPVLTDRSSLPDIPPSPVLPPVRPPSSRDSASIHSWRLSYNAGQPGRIIGGNPEHLSRQASASQEGISALGTWLLAQGLQSRDSSVAPLDEAKKEDMPAPSASAIWRASAGDFGGVDGGHIEIPESVYLYPMNIPSTLPSRDPSKTSIAHIEKTWDEPFLEECLTPLESLHKDKGWQANGIKERSTPGENGSAEALHNAAQDASSSVYPSTISSLQPTSLGSFPEFADISFSMTSLHGLQLTPFKCESGPPGRAFVY
jgi:hypothetical protein